jgi:hypothetical protein
MNKVQKRFILRKLIPFILREQGRGFAMSTWADKHLAKGSRFEFDEVERLTPVCGTVACIGGSVDVLKGYKTRTWRRAAKALGLSDLQANTLFFRWDVGDGWPERFRHAYAKAKQPLTKAKVACALLREVVRTNGACLGEN